MNTPHQPQPYTDGCPGADDPEERCPRHPKDCTCWQVDLNWRQPPSTTQSKIGEIGQ